MQNGFSKMTLLALAVASFLLYGLSWAQPEPHVFRISCGARHSVKSPPSYTLWHEDTSFTGGIAAKSIPSIDTTPALPTLRYFPVSEGPNNCYTLNQVPMGHYTLRIFFGRLNKTGFEEEPIFSVSIEGTLVSSLNPGWSNKDDQVFTEALVFLLNRTTSICFHRIRGDPAIVALEILEINAEAYSSGNNLIQNVLLTTTKRLNCGVKKAKFDDDYNGVVWSANRYWSPSVASDSKADTRILTEKGIQFAFTYPNLYPELLYQSALVGENISYSLDVEPSHIYSLWFHFAELEATVSKGERICDITVNKILVFRDIDIIEQSGGQYSALVLNTTVVVTSEPILVINLHPKVGKCLLSAIEVFAVIKREILTAVNEVLVLERIKNELGIPVKLGWNGDPCSPRPWLGLSCKLDSTGTKMELFNQGLKGLLSNDICNLVYLQKLNLSINAITGVIPTLLGSIASLEVLDLSFNSFSGSLPQSLRESTSLRILKLEGNPLLVSASRNEGPHRSSRGRKKTVILSIFLVLIGVSGLVVAVVCVRSARVNKYAEVRLQREVSLTHTQ